MCLYQCINGQLKLVESDCPAKPCDDPAPGSCSGSSGDIITMPCPPPFGRTLVSGQQPKQVD